MIHDKQKINHQNAHEHKSTILDSYSWGFNCQTDNISYVFYLINLILLCKCKELLSFLK